MLYDYDAELVNVLIGFSVMDQTYAGQLDAYGLSIGANIERLQGEGARILYFPPGRYLLEARALEWVCERGCEWFFAAGAVLAVDWGATLIIRGTIRAGVQQIFGLNRIVRSPRDINRDPISPEPLPSTINTWPLAPLTAGGPPAGRIIIESDDVPLVRPEWWGAFPWNTNPIQTTTNEAEWYTFDSSDAFQGAIDAACIERARRGKAPIPIVLTARYQTTRSIEVHAPTAGIGVTPVSLVWRGDAGVRGSIPSVVRTNVPAMTRATPEVVLRLNPGVDFDLQDVNLAVRDNVEGCLDVLCDRRDPAGRRGLLRRVTLGGGVRFRLRIHESDTSPVRRQFIVDACALNATPNVASLHGILLDAGPGVMLRVSNTGMITASLPSDQPWTSDVENQSTCHLTGGSVMMDTLLFHMNVGPRPSREPPEFDRPDGQDVFLGASSSKGRAGTHLTMMQCESQSWWLLSRDSRMAASRQTVLVGVVHACITGNWGVSLARAQAWGIPDPDIRRRAPSIIWRGAHGRCVLVGCRLDESIMEEFPSTVMSVGVAFYRNAAPDPASSVRMNYLRDTSEIPRRGNGYRLPPGARVVSDDASIRRVVPIREEPVR